MNVEDELVQEAWRNLRHLNGIALCWDFAAPMPPSLRSISLYDGATVAGIFVSVALGRALRTGARTRKAACERFINNASLFSSTAQRIYLAQPSRRRLCRSLFVCDGRYSLGRLFLGALFTMQDSLLLLWERRALRCFLLDL